MVEASQWLRLALLVALGLMVGTGTGLWATNRLRHRLGHPTHVLLPPARDARLLSTALCPEGMKYVPAGPFQMGAPAEDALKELDDWSATWVAVKAFCIDEYEYPDRLGERPRTRASWTDAQWLCTLQHKKLCTEAEWEKACKGPDNFRFPYGKDYVSSACRTELSDASGPEPSGSAKACRSAYGVFDLSGNLAEWTLDVAPQGRALKGGAYDAQDKGARCASRLLVPADTHSPTVGFRCCKRPANEEKEEP